MRWIPPACAAGLPPVGQWLGLLALAGVLAACAGGTEVPSVIAPTLPRGWRGVPAVNPSASSVAPRPVAWWRDLQDPALTGWIELALQNNRDLVRNALRLQQASVLAERSGLEGRPRYSSSLGTSAQQSFQRTAGVGTTQVNGVTVPIETRESRISTSANSALSLAHEVDMWGRVAHNLSLARQDLALAETDLQIARWLLTTQVAEQYWSLATLDAKRPHLERALADAQAGLAAVALRLSLGKARQGELDKAHAAVHEATQSLHTLGRQREQHLHTMALLLDQAPQDFQVLQAVLPAHDPQEPANWPVAAVLDRLPGVQRARLSLDQALTRLQIARTNRYPQLSLSAGLSSSGNQLRNVLANPFGSLGLNMALPMLDWQRLGLERDNARRALTVAELDFREVLFKALAEVEQQYTQRRQWQADAQLLRQKTAHAQHALAVAQLRFEQGADPLQSVRDAQAGLRELQLQALDLRLRAWLNQVAIFKAWGGPLEGPAPGAAQ